MYDLISFGILKVVYIAIVKKHNCLWNIVHSCCYNSNLEMLNVTIIKIILKKYNDYSFNNYI